jgi:hypothetical protein
MLIATRSTSVPIESPPGPTPEPLDPDVAVVEAEDGEGVPGEADDGLAAVPDEVPGDVPEVGPDDCPDEGPDGGPDDGPEGARDDGDPLVAALILVIEPGGGAELKPAELGTCVG